MNDPRPDSPAADADVIERIDAVFAERVAAGTAPSSVWGVFDADGLLASGGHGDRGDGRAPDADTVYRIASCTKSVTAATLLSLVERGAVGLDAPVTDFVPAFSDVVLPTADSPVPTLRMLLTMSGGFPTDDPWADRQEPISDADLDQVLRDGLLFDSVPGTRFAYSNLGYALLGRVVSAVAGRPFTEVATEVVLDPLGLRATRFTADDEAGYVVTGTRPFAGGWEPLPLSGPGAFSPIGGLFSTVADLARWARHLGSAFDPTMPDDPAAPIPRAARRLMQQMHRHIPARGLSSARRPIGYGFGLFVEDDERFGTIASHSGGYPGFSAHMRWSVATGLGVVAFENATQAKVSEATERAHDLLLDSATPVTPLAEVLPATRTAQHAVQGLLAAWSSSDGLPRADALADTICTPNVALDVPYDRRRVALAEAVERTGADPAGAPYREESATPTHLRWWVRGERGDLRVEIRLAPLGAGLVQTLTVAAEAAGR